MTSHSLGASPLLSRPGAVTDPNDPAVAWHYGDPLGEQRAADRGPILIDRWTAGTVEVSGADRLSWLHALSSQHFDDLGEHGATEALWLSSRGHIEHWADVSALDGRVRLRTEPNDAAALTDFLQSMRFRSDVAVVDRSAELATMTVAGRGADEAAATALGTPIPAAGRCAPVESGPAAGGSVRRFPDRLDITVPRDRAGAVAMTLIDAGCVPAGTWAHDALRIAARRPRFGIDNDDRTLPNETPWLATAVHLNKGCYRGQETVAKIENVGRPPRRMVLVNLDGSADRLPAPGDSITTAQGRSVGRVGTVAQHWEDGPIALALVKRTIEPGVPLLLGGGSGSDSGGGSGSGSGGGSGGVDGTIDPDDGVPPDRRVAIDRRAFHDFRRR